MKRIKYSILLYLLLLFSFSCTVQPANVIDTDETIVDAYWVLMSLEGEKIPEAIDTRTAYIRFEERENDVNGYTGCNRFFGKYERTGDSLRISKLNTTRTMCTSIDQENKMIDVLSRVDSYRRSRNVLTFFQEGKAVATFMTGNPEVIENELNRQEQ